MDILKLEHSRSAYLADFILYDLAVIGLALFLKNYSPLNQWFAITLYGLLGLVSWSFIEYALHRFVLHGISPFSSWHAMHHKSPSALICTPTIFSFSLITIFVFLPAFLLGGIWLSCALTLGVLTGYLIYSMTHHCIHHLRSKNRWLTQRKRWHALHHHIGNPGYYGVTSGFWDYVFKTCL